MTIDWDALHLLAQKLDSADLTPTGLDVAEWSKLDSALSRALRERDDEAVVRLRLLFGFLLARDTVTGLQTMQRLEREAIESAKRLEDWQNLADFLGAQGHNLHRKGYHEEAIESFEQAYALYTQLDQPFEALKNWFMTALCHRALGDREKAQNIIRDILQNVDEHDPWRGNPLQVRAWLLRDEGRLEEAEQAMRAALEAHAQVADGDILVAGALADLGEILSMQRRFTEAEPCFRQSLAILARHPGQYQRQVARTQWKYGEMLIETGQPNAALTLLAKADDAIRPYGAYYDLLWRIELARALAYIKLHNLPGAWRKFRITLRLRRELNLSNWILVKQMLRRFF
ncbi:MAG: tetratricopeptide repeat protein [Chloroflexi bacterium]|nr:tetratricopeptide repeat protein [Chloroflexota bacterium]